MKRLFSNLVKPFEGERSPPPQQFRPFLFWAMRGAGWTIVLAGVASFAVGLGEAFGSLIIGWLIDTALGAPQGRFFQENIGMLILAALFFVVLRPLMMTFSAACQGVALAPNIFPLAFMRLHRHTLGQALRFFDDDFAGRLAQKQIQSASSLTEVVSEATNAFSFAAASILGAVVILAQIDGRLGLVLLIWIVSFVRVIRWFLPRIRRRAKERAAARAAATGQVVDTLTNMATVKLFAHTDLEEEYARDAISLFREKALNFGILNVGFRGAMMSLAGILPVVLLGGTLWLWQQGDATTGEIAIAGLLSTRIAQMSGWISFTAMAVFAHLGEAEDGMNTLSPSHGIIDKPTATTPEHTKGDLRFRNVSHRYGKEIGGGLQTFDLEIPAGQKVGLVGRSGAGKTTAISLLLRFYDVDEGSIELDGQDIRDLTQDGLRRQISMVRQETSMFNRSAADNIRYGRPDASQAEVVTAAKQAEALEFIHDLQDIHGRRGFEAYLGERGVKLSGGQRQRIALARAMLKDAPVLILDEATSALDSEAEAAIQLSLESLMKGKTVIAIAHRLSTIARMDRIIVMEDGHIAEDGTHGELLARNGLYAGFWKRQSGGFIGVEAAE
jgi:ATP-binding cassette subfamily B protein